MGWYRLLVAAVFLMCVTSADAPLFRRRTGVPELSEFKSFRIHVEGRTQRFGTDDKLKKQVTSKGTKNVYTIKHEGPTGEAEMIGNQGIGTVEFMRTDRSLVIMESPLLGSTHYLIVYNDWSRADEGFRCVYVRHILPNAVDHIFENARGSILSVRVGVAKPLVHQD